MSGAAAPGSASAAASGRTAAGGFLLEVEGLRKSFGAIEALRGVSLTLRAGEVVAVVGENGAGKSTLIKILAGIHRPDGGTVRLEGRALDPRSPAESMRSGVAVIHQELHLADNLSIAANLFLGREPLRWRALGWIDRRRMEAESRDALARVGLDRLPRELVATLSPAARQLVEIARAVGGRQRCQSDALLVVMDEPTSSLGRDEAARLLDLVEDLRRRGLGVLYVSHRLEEVVRVADRAVVLRDGLVAGELGRGEIDAGALVALMVGRRGPHRDGTPRSEPLRPDSEARPRGELENGAPTGTRPVVLTATRLRTAPSAPELSFELHAGEILGLFGLVGAGRTELLEALFGLRPAAGGEIIVSDRGVAAGDHEARPGHEGEAAPGPDGASERRPRSATGRWLRRRRSRSAPASVAAAIAAGMALVPEDRKALGLVAEMTVAENLMLADQARRPSLAWRRRGMESRRAAALIERLDIRPASPTAPVRRLSGGNQQKVVLGKWLTLEPRILLLDEPTRGVDVAARAEIHQRLRALADHGVAILLSSAETDEVLALADRVVVLRRGEIAGVVAGESRVEETLLRLAAGGSAPPPARTRMDEA